MSLLFAILLYAIPALYVGYTFYIIILFYIFCFNHKLSAFRVFVNLS